MALKKTNKEDMTSVVDRIEEENMRSLSDIPTDEDGVVRDVPLLAGVEYQDQLLRTFSFREMTGRDEEAINKPDIRSNGVS